MEGLDEGTFHWATAPGAVVRAGWRSAAAGGYIGAIVLSRGSKGNAWNGDMWRDWDTALALLAAQEDVRAVRSRSRGAVGVSPRLSMARTALLAPP